MLRKTIFCLSALGLAVIAAAPASADNMYDAAAPTQNFQVYPPPGSPASGAGVSRSSLTSTILTRYNEGYTALQANQYKPAQRAFREVLAILKDDANTNYLMGRSLAADNKASDSVAYLRKAVNANAELAPARGWLGYALVKSGKADKASAQKTALVALKAKCARMCADAADIDDAIRQIDAAIANPAA